MKRKQVHVVRRLLTQWCTNMLRSKVEAMKAVARMIRSHLDGILAGKLDFRTINPHGHA